MMQLRADADALHPAREMKGGIKTSMKEKRETISLFLSFKMNVSSSTSETSRLIRSAASTHPGLMD
jgi:hypothetical protein